MSATLKAAAVVALSLPAAFLAQAQTPDSLSKQVATLEDQRK
jgi:hypothetical protein